MTFPAFKSALGFLGLVALTGCQLIAGLHDRITDPPPGPGCAILSSGAGEIRVVNLGTTSTGSGKNAVATRADFCIRPSGTTDWGRPIFRDGGTDYGDAAPPIENLCTMGLPYAQATVGFGVPAGKIDVKAITAGLTCAAPATSELDGITVGAYTVGGSAPLVTVMRYGGGEKQPEAIVALPEEPGSQTNSSDLIRVVNALNASDSINFGPTAGSVLPTTVPSPLFSSGIAPGTTPAAQTTTLGQIDQYGYQASIPGAINFGLAYANDSSGEAFALTQPPSQAVTETLYAIGDKSDANNTFPVRGLVCQDRFAASAGPDAGPDGGTPASESSLLQECALTAFPDISVDIWNVSLYGANAPFADQRAPAIPEAIGERASDIVCITEADDKTNRQNIINYTLTHGYPYSYDVDTTVATQPTNPAEADGTIPKPMDGIPCAGISPSIIDTAYTCAEKYCQNDAGALLGSTNCIETNCLDQFLPLFHPNPPAGNAMDAEDNVCFDCIVLNLDDPTETYEDGKKTCTTVSAPAYAYEGQTPLLILSRHPFASTKFYAYPSTGLRRGILKAQVELQAGLKVDFFCTQLISPQIYGTVAYVGPYGVDSLYGAPDGGFQNGWSMEQLLQANDAITWIGQETSNDNLPGIIAGSWYSTIPQPQLPIPLGSLSTTIMEAIDDGVTTNGNQGAWTRAEPPGYVRLCDSCATNPYTSGAPNLEFNALFLTNWPGGSSAASNATISESLWATDLGAVQLTSEPNEPAPASGAGPLSVYFAHNNVLVRPTQ